MSDFLAALLSALVATNQPAAVSNVIVQRTGVPIAVPDKNDPVEQEFQKLLAADDAAQAEVDQWILDSQKHQAEGDKLSSITLKARINQRFEPVKNGYEDFIQRHPKHAGVHLAYGSFLSDIADEDGAKEQFEKAVAIDPKSPPAWNNLGNYYGHNGRVDKAFECYGKALELKPNEAVYYENLATTLYMFRHDATNYFRITEHEVFERALALYRKALELDPNNFSLATDWAQSYYGIPVPKTGDAVADRRAAQQFADQALAVWKTALKLAKDDQERQGVYVHFARIQINAGRFEDARQSLSLVTNDVLVALRDRLLKKLRESERKSEGTNNPPSSLDQK